MFDFEMYLDDSGTHVESPIAIAACYVAEKAQWDHFVRDWDEAREEYGFDVFHMKDFMAHPDKGRKPFCDWSSDKKNKLYSRLAAIINTRARHGFGFAVPTEAFRKYVPERVQREVTSDAFTFAVQSLLSLVRSWYERYGQGKSVRYVFDDRQSMGKVRQIWDTMKEHPEHAAKLGMMTNSLDGFAFSNANCSKPLQAADILAWNLNSHMRDVILKGRPDAENCRPYFRQLRQRFPMKLGFQTDNQVKQAFVDLVCMEADPKHEGKRPYLLPRKLEKLYGTDSIDGMNYPRKVNMNPFSTFDRTRRNSD